MTRRGFLGGTFDPIHVGHLDVARAALSALGLDEVVLVPANIPPHRSAPRASASHRFAMAALAVQFESRLLVSDLEMSAPGPSYTSATLNRLAGRGLDTHTLFLITGADAFRDIASWKDYPAILDRCHFVVVSRPDHGVAGLRAALPDLAGRMVNAGHRPFAEPCIILVDAPTAAVSSTDIRRRVAEGASLDGLVPDAVAAHIRRHRLYQLDAPGELAT